MAKIINKADKLVFKAFQRAVLENKIQLCLINSRLNIPASPVYNPWENLLPILCPVLLGLIFIAFGLIITGLAIMVAGIMLSSNFVKKELEHRLYERTKNQLLQDYSSCDELWNFGGIVLVNNQDRKQACISPDGSWQEFVILHFSDLMIDDKVTAEVNDNIDISTPSSKDTATEIQGQKDEKVA